MEDHSTTMEKIVSLCKRRGFVFQSSEIYGGQNGAWDYGPLGIELKNNIQKAWWREMTQLHDSIVGLHVANFSDPLVDCKDCKSRFRADDDTQISPENVAARKCPKCGGPLTEPRSF